MKLRLLLRRYGVSLLAVLAMGALGTAVSAVILSEQGFDLPWKDFYEVSAEFENAQAVAPGQGQRVTVSGVQVGEVSRLELDDGLAVVTVQIEERYAPIYRDATMLLRPRTAAKDMEVAVDPGTPEAGELPDGAVLPVTRTAPDVNTDELFATLDSDTRDYLKLTVAGIDQGLEGRGRTLRRILEATQPTTEQLRRVARALAGRRREIARLVHNLNLVAKATAKKDQELARAVATTAATFEPLARQDSALREAVGRLPGTLAAAEPALRHGRELAGALEPAAAALRRPARSLALGLRDVRPLLADATPVVRDELRPLARKAVPWLGDLRPAARDLGATAPRLLPVADDVNYALNELGHDPEGPERGYLYYVPWFTHNVASMLSAEDAHGAFWRGLLLFSCSNLAELLELGPGPGPPLELDPSLLAACPGGGG